MIDRYLMTTTRALLGDGPLIKTTRFTASRMEDNYVNEESGEFEAVIDLLLSMDFSFLFLNRDTVEMNVINPISFSN